MLRCVPRIFIALLGWLALCGVNPPSQQSESADRGAKAAPAPSPSRPPAPNTGPRPPIELAQNSEHYPDACRHTDNHETSNLCAQWRSTIAAEKSAHEARRASNFALIAGALSFVTIIGLITTIWQTFGALGEARRANKLSEDALSEGRDAARKQIRAYVTARVTSVYVRDVDDPKPKFGVTIAFENNGASPAIGLRSVRADQPLVLPHYPAQGAFEMPGDPKLEGGSSSALGSAASTFVSSRFSCAIEYLTSMLDRDERLFFPGSIFYRDVFGDPHRTNYCFYLKPEVLLSVIERERAKDPSERGDSTKIDIKLIAAATANQWNDMS